MTTFKKKICENIPALFCHKNDLAEAAKRGTVILYHGMTSHKEANLKEIRSIAELGYLAIGIDAHGHGERFNKDLMRRCCGENFWPHMLEAVEKSAQEVPLIINELISNKLIYNNKIAICGISMGGYITYRALTLDKRISVATPIISSPFWGRRI